MVTGTCECATTTCNLVKATATRCLFIMQSIVTTWRVVDVKGSTDWWWMLISLITIVIEGFYSLCKRKGAEHKWFSPSYLCFLICTVPGIWLLELDRWEKNQALRANVTSNSNTSIQQLSSIVGVTIPIAFDADTWIQGLEQVLMLLLVFSRWMLPKGEITRERLSQILLVYIALASDIIELFDLYELDEVMKDWLIFRIILISWTVSLLQFTLVLATNRARTARPNSIGPAGATSAPASKVDCVEVLALMLTLVLQDVPFLCIRLYIIIDFRKLSNTLLFFAAKNALVIALQFYRLSIVLGVAGEEEDADGDGVQDQPEAIERGKGD